MSEADTSPVHDIGLIPTDVDGQDGRPVVPHRVLRAIDDIKEGNTASKEDIESVLNF
ncbi:hypothetical protein [Haloarcula nitratireducens]|uniref:Uncharacterized protein n=1 Tax=Haloarcula nitratireducens TaxID=2487749 RepID=A0AAW4PFC7_9EURY|nr:hypothetical protein [Halomicroarcula nitratireducens]MBX0296649.1 hypothetical protein [Halomicroarcula nitratireducens]